MLCSAKNFKSRLLRQMSAHLLNEKLLRQETCTRKDRQRHCTQESQASGLDGQALPTLSTKMKEEASECW